MIEKFYTVDQISQMLNIHPKTIQRYIREGKLRAAKIGKGWRISGNDLSLFTEKEQVNNNSISGKDRIKVSSVVDIVVYNREEAMYVVDMLTAVVNSKPPEYGISSMHTQHITQESIVRISLWGGIRFMEVVMASIAALSDKLIDEEG